MDPFENPIDEEQTTPKFLCCLHNLSGKKGVRVNGMMPADIYKRLGQEAAEGKVKTQLHLSSECFEIERVWMR